MLTTAGIHPYEVTESVVGTLDHTIQQLRDLLHNHPQPFVAVGECGLDFSNGFPPRHQQLQVFHAQVALAVEMQKPMFVHVRDAFKECFAVLDSINGANVDADVDVDGGGGGGGGGGASPSPSSPSSPAAGLLLPPVIIHCFTGTEKEMLGCIERGYSMSFSGILCRNDSTGINLRKILRKILIPMVKRNFFESFCTEPTVF